MEYKIEVVHEATGEVVKTLSYPSESQQERAYMGVIKNMNWAEYTARTVMPELSEQGEQHEQTKIRMVSGNSLYLEAEPVKSCNIFAVVCR